MIEDFAIKLVNLQVKHAKTFLLIIVLITVAMLPGIASLVGHVEPSLEKVLPTDIEEVRLMNHMRSQFGADMMYLLVSIDGPAYDVRQPDVLIYMDTLAQKLREREYILEVNTLADPVLDHYGYIPSSTEQISQVLDAYPMSLELSSARYDLAIIRIRSDTGALAHLINEVVVAIEQDIDSLEQKNPGVGISITGFNAIDRATFQVIISDFIKITAVSMALVMLVVLFSFRDVIKAMLPMAVVFAALIWTLGIAGYLGLTITVVSMVAAAMILGLGIDFGIHQVHTYFEERKKNKPKKALSLTMQELLRAMVGASTTTTAGFLALLFGVLPAMKTLGIILAIGIMSTLLNAALLLPVLIYTYDSGDTT